MYFLFLYYVDMFVFLDVFGYCDFIKNMIIGIFQVDCVIFIIVVGIGEFEVGIFKDGQICEYVFFVYIFGVKQFIVVINKMDIIKWFEVCFNEIIKEIFNFIKKVGYNFKIVVFVFIFGFNGDNMFEVFINCFWYKGWEKEVKGGKVIGKIFFEVIDFIEFFKCFIDKFFCFFFQDVYKIGGIGIVFVGCIEIGIFKFGMVVIFVFFNVIIEVKFVEMYYEQFVEGVFGDNVGFNVKNVFVKEICCGNVVGDFKNDFFMGVVFFDVQVIVFNYFGQVGVGYVFVFDCYIVYIVCKFFEFLQKIDCCIGKVVEESFKFIKFGDVVIVKMVFFKFMCVEVFIEYFFFGCFVVCDMCQIVVVGVIKKVEKVVVGFGKVIKFVVKVGKK